MMKKDAFEIVLERGEDVWRGRLQLQVDESGVFGMITLAGQQSFFRGKALRKDRYILSVDLCADGWAEDCDALLSVGEDGALTGVFLSPQQICTLTGTRQDQLTPSR